jgi:2,4-dienoyl-CoA reductase-like NADH-dependent reductase (Old Yellow Enzyme family)/nucleotide-binding universal stress UspA family protein
MNTVNIFSPFRIGGLPVKNRLVALPVYTGYAHPDGRVSSQLIDHYAQLGRSGVGMVVVANAAVAADGVTTQYTLRADQDEYISGLSTLAKTIKDQGALACLQLNHAGRFAKTDRPLLPAALDSAHLGFNVAALKNFMNFFPLEKRFILTRHFLKQAGSWRRSMSAEDRARIVVDFGEAAERAYAAGFDMVELHGANGYLLCQFLSPFTNRHSTDWGGTFEKRIKFPLVVVEAIRQRLPSTFPVGFRLILSEGVPGGIELPEALRFAKILEEEGVAYISAASGSYHSIFSPETLAQMARPAYLRKKAAELTAQVHIPTIISGRIITPAVANRIIRQGVADLIGLGRPLRADIEWVAKAAANDRRIRTCLNCHWCVKRVILEEGFSCRRWPRLIQQRADLNHQLIRRSTRRVWIIAGRDDVQLFKAASPLLLPESRHLQLLGCPAILFLDTDEPDESHQAERRSFLEWAGNLVDHLGISGAEIDHRVRAVAALPDKDVLAEIKQSNFGEIFIARDARQRWRERLTYQLRRKVLALIGAHARPADVVVPVDFSPATLLVLMLVRQSYLYQTGFTFTFLHVLSEPGPAVEKQWKAFLKITGIDKDLPLKLLPSTGNVAFDLLKFVAEGNFGTIIMGKRGVSGIKRWLLGSVSAGVLRGLTNQSLFLVD